MKIKKFFIAFSVISIVLAGILSFLLSATSADKRSDESKTGQLIAQANHEPPPFVQKMLEERGMSPEALQNNPEMRGEFLEEMKKVRGERGDQPKRKKAGGSKKGSEKGGGEFSYYKDIVDNNLFRPLGWGPKKQEAPFILRATICSPNIPSASKAIIWVRAGNKERTVTIGDEIGGSVIEMIADGSVTMQKDGTPMELSTGGMVFLGAPAGGGGRRGRSSGGGKQQQAKRSSSKGRSNRDMQNRLKKMSAEQQRRMADEMRRRRGGGRGGRSFGGRSGRRGGGDRGGRGGSSRRMRRR